MLGLLQSLMGGGNDPLDPNTLPGQDPTTAPSPQPVTPALPAAAPDRPSLLHRVGHALAAAEGAISNSIRPNLPPGYEDLAHTAGLSDADIQSARPSLFRSIFSSDNDPSAQDRFAQNIDNAVQHKQAAVGIAQQARVMAARHSIVQQFPPPTNGSEADVAKWANQVLPFLMAHEDFDGVKMLQPIVDQFAKNLHARPYEPQLYKHATTGEYHYFDPTSETQIPAGFNPVFKPGSQGMGTAQVWSDGKGHFESAMPGDNEKIHQLAAQGFKPDVDARTQFVQGMQQGRFDETTVKQQAQAFAKDNSSVAKLASLYPGFKAVAAQASTNPAAFKSFITQMAPLLDPNMQLRLGTIMYAQKIDPSFKGSLSRWLSEKANGTLPADQVANVVKVVDAVVKDQRKAYDTRRQSLVSQFPGIDRYEGARSSADMFADDTDTAGGAASTPAPRGTPTGKYSPDNPFAKGKK